MQYGQGSRMEAVQHAGWYAQLHKPGNQAVLRRCAGCLLVLMKRKPKDHAAVYDHGHTKEVHGPEQL